MKSLPEVARDLGEHWPGPLVPHPTSLGSVPKLIWRKSEVAVLLAMSESSIDNRINSESPWYDPDFPRPVPLSSGRCRTAIGWRYHELVQWVMSRPHVADVRQLDTPIKSAKRARMRVDESAA